MKSTTDIPLREAAELKRADFRKGLNQRSITKTELGIVVTASVVFASTYAISKGQDINWDQLNYHLYSVYAVLYSRHHIDIMPSQLQTWTNPIGNVLQYLLIMTLPSRVASVLLAALASVSVAVVYSLTKRTLDETGGGGRNFRIFVAAIAALGGLFSPIFLSEVGTTYNDYYGSILILLALWLFIRKADGMRTYLVIGALLGVAVGVKLTNAIFILGWVAAIVAVDATSAWRPLLLSGIGAFAAYIPVGGIWNAYVYGLFNNPVFPLYNNIFKSDAYGHVSMLDTRFKPHSVAEALTYFPRWALGDPTTTELVFRDTRFMFSAFLFCLALPRMLAVVMPRRKGDAPPIFDPERSRFILVFSIVSFVIWLAAFGIERYALVLEQVAPLIFLILLSHLCGGRRVFAQAAVMGMGLIIATSKYCPIGVERRFQTIGIKFQRPLRFGRMARCSSCFPANPPPISFRIYRSQIPSFASREICRSIPASALELWRRPGSALTRDKFALWRLADYPLDQSKRRLETFGLAIGAEDCLFIDTKIGRLRSCSLRRS